MFTAYISDIFIHAKTLAQIILTFLILILIWEHVGRLYSFKRPSIFISWIADWLTWGFAKVGSFFAYLSSFYTYIKFGEILITLQDIFSPSWRAITSPYHFIRGYVSTMNLQKYPGLVVLGSATLIVVLISVADYIFGQYIALPFPERYDILVQIIRKHEMFAVAVIGIIFSILLIIIGDPSNPIVRYY